MYRAIVMAVFLSGNLTGCSLLHPPSTSPPPGTVTGVTPLILPGTVAPEAPRPSSEPVSVPVASETPQPSPVVAVPTTAVPPTLGGAVPWRFGKKVENPPLEPYISYETYMKLTNSMSYEQVCALFGRPGIEEHFFRSGDSSTGTYRWKNADRSYVYIIFNGYKDTNRLSAKTNHNLR